MRPILLRRARRALAAAAAVGLLSATACARETVRISFEPAVGATYGYVVDVESRSATSIQGQEPTETDNSFAIRVEHEVQSSDADGSEVQVTLRTGDSTPARELLVRLDRGAQLTEVIEVEGLPADVLGELGLSEIFPAAVAAPPDRALEPGATWRIDSPVQMTGSPRERLVGSGRLVELDVRDGRSVAVVRSSYRLPVSRQAEGANSSRDLEGVQVTRSTTTYDLADGSVVESDAVTTGTFTVQLRPPEGADGPSLVGSLEVEVRSHTQRKGR